MKKFISLIMVGVLLVAGCLPVFAQSSDDYDCIIYPRTEVFYFDSEKGGSVFQIGISTSELKCYEYVQYDISFNKEIINYDNYVFTNEGVYLRDCAETETGVSYKVSIPKDSLEGTPDGDNVSLYCNIVGIGEIDFCVNAFSVLPDGSKKELKVCIKPFYNKVVELSELEFVNKENINVQHIEAKISNGMTVKEFTDLSKNKTAVIKNKDNVVLDKSAVIPNGAYFVTVYEGFVVDKIKILVKYDVNCDGEVTAGDARLALRQSAQIEDLFGASYYAADVDGVSGITASDARKILRFASGLE